jgi:hypothetical protein
VCAMRGHIGGFSVSVIARTLSPDATIDVHGWMLPVTKFTAPEVERAAQLQIALKQKPLSNRHVVTSCRDACSQILDLVHASVHRANPRLSRAAVSTVIYDFEHLMLVYRRIALLTFGRRQTD